MNDCGTAKVISGVLQKNHNETSGERWPVSFFITSYQCLLSEGRTITPGY